MRILELLVALIGLVLLVLGVLNLLSGAVVYGLVEGVIGLALLAWASHRHPTARL